MREGIPFGASFTTNTFLESRESARRILTVAYGLDGLFLEDGEGRIVPGAPSTIRINSSSNEGDAI